MVAEFARPADTVAILLGASDWPDLDISGGEWFSNSFEDFEAYLRHPDGLALPDSHIFAEFNKASATGTITSGIIDFLRKHRANEGKIIHNVLLYLLGQGGLDGEFYFAIGTSKKKQYQTTFFSATAIAKLLLEEARPCRHYVIIDACHAGAAGNVLWKSPNGACLLCSARANELSQFKSSSSSARIRTQFTGALLDILYGANETEPLAVVAHQEPFRLSFEAICGRIRKRVEDLDGEKAVLPELRPVGGPRLEGIAWLPVVCAGAKPSTSSKIPTTASANPRVVIEPPRYSVRAEQTIGALAIWREKLAYLQQQEAIIADSAQSFALKKQIEYAKNKIQELSE